MQCSWYFPCYSLMVMLLLKALWRESAAVSLMQFWLKPSFSTQQCGLLSKLKMECYPISVILYRLLQSSNSQFALFPFRPKDRIHTPSLSIWRLRNPNTVSLECGFWSNDDIVVHLSLPIWSVLRSGVLKPICPASNFISLPPTSSLMVILSGVSD